MICAASRASLLALIALLGGCDQSPAPASSSTPATAATSATAAAPTSPVASPTDDAPKAVTGLQRGWPFAASWAPPSDQDAPGVASLQRNYYVVFDASGSMSSRRCAGSDTKLAVAKRALIAFGQQLPGQSHLGLTVFDERGVREILPLGPQPGGALEQAIAGIQAGGGTPLAASIQRAYVALTLQARRQLGYGEYHLVVVTDGDATGPDPRPVVNTAFDESPVVLHTVGFCIGTEHALNQPGKVVYRSADNAAELASGLADVLAESPQFQAHAFR